MSDDIVQRMERVADELNRRIRTCHERLACPKCGAPVGELCRRLPKGYMLAYTGEPREYRMGAVVGPHRERWTQETPLR